LKWQSKSLPDSGASQNARKALSGAMPNREAMSRPGSLSGRQLKSVNLNPVGYSDIRFREIDAMPLVRWQTEFGLLSSLTRKLMNKELRIENAKKVGDF